MIDYDKKERNGDVERLVKAANANMGVNMQTSTGVNPTCEEQRRYTFRKVCG